MTRLQHPAHFAWRAPDPRAQDRDCRSGVELHLYWGRHRQVVARFSRSDLSPAHLHLAGVDLTYLNQLWEDPVENIAWLVHAAHIFCISVRSSPSLALDNWLNHPKPWPHPVDSINELLRPTRGHLVLEEQMQALLLLAGAPADEHQGKINQWRRSGSNSFGETTIDGTLKLRALVESAALPSRDLVTRWPESELKEALRLAYNWFSEEALGGILSPFKHPGKNPSARDLPASPGDSRQRKKAPACSFCGNGSETQDRVVGANFVLCRSCFADALHDRLVQDPSGAALAREARLCGNCTAQLTLGRGAMVAETLGLCVTCTTVVLSAFLESTDE